MTVATPTYRQLVDRRRAVDRVNPLGDDLTVVIAIAHDGRSTQQAVAPSIS